MHVSFADQSAGQDWLPSVPARIIGTTTFERANTTEAPCAINKPLIQDISHDTTFPIEYINDSGAGRTILSERSLCSQGIPKSFVFRVIGKASAPISFDTGGGSSRVQSINWFVQQDTWQD